MFLDTVGSNVFLQNIAQEVLAQAGNAWNDHPELAEQAYESRLLTAQQEGHEVDGNWGRDHFFENPERAALAMRRSGILGLFQGLHWVWEYIPRHPMQKPHYYKFQERLNPMQDRCISYVNGMQTPLRGLFMTAEADARLLSERFAHNLSFKCVYNPTAGPDGDMEVYNELNQPWPVYTRTAFLIAQQWIDYLDGNPNGRFLQIAFSAGATQTRAALRLLRECNLLHFINRISIITLCPATFITPTIDDRGLPEGIRVEVLNIFKMEDEWPAGADRGNVEQYRLPDGHFPPYIRQVPHEELTLPAILPDGTHGTIPNSPHNLHSIDYHPPMSEATGQFLRTGRIFP